MAQTALKVFEGFGKGMMSGTDAWKEFIAEDIEFIGPVAQVSGKEAFVQLNKSFMTVIQGNKMKQVEESGNWIITQIEMDLATPSGKTITLDMSEWYKIENDKIQSIKVYYDAEEFRKEMETAN